MQTIDDRQTLPDGAADDVHHFDGQHTADSRHADDQGIDLPDLSKRCFQGIKYGNIPVAAIQQYAGVLTGSGWVDHGDDIKTFGTSDKPVRRFGVAGGQQTVGEDDCAVQEVEMVEYVE